MLRATIRAVLLVFLLLSRTWGEEPLHRVTFTGESGRSRTVAGRLLVEATDGGLLVSGRDGRLWTITPEQLQNHDVTEEAFEPFTADELATQLHRELGPDFEIVRTKHYVLCTNAGREYARWCGLLFERLMDAFLSHWKSSGLEVEEPDSPLPAIVFARKEQFARYAAEDAGRRVASSKSYYSVRTNRIVLYDLASEVDSGSVNSVADVRRKLAAAPFNVATVVHEATHQIAFNCGLHTRYADNPMWLTEGMALYFETPDLSNRAGWRTVGKINPRRFRRFVDFVRNRRDEESLITLISSDDRFRDRDTQPDAYAEAWALTYFLIKTRRDDYAKYLRQISGKPPLVWDTPDERLEEFRAAFGEDLEQLDRQFLRYFARRLRR